MDELPYVQKNRARLSRMQRAGWRFESAGGLLALLAVYRGSGLSITWQAPEVVIQCLRMRRPL